VYRLYSNLSTVQCTVLQYNNSGVMTKSKIALTANRIVPRVHALEEGLEDLAGRTAWTLSIN